MKKMVTQVNFCLFVNAFFCLACNTVPENWQICVNIGLTYIYLLNDERLSLHLLIVVAFVEILKSDVVLSKEAWVLTLCVIFSPSMPVLDAYHHDIDG